MSQGPDAQSSRPQFRDTQTTEPGQRWYASPAAFYPVAGRLARWCGVAAVALAALGLYIGFFLAPAHADRGDAYRIVFVHLPASWMSVFVYLAMAGWGAVGLLHNTPLPTLMARALAPTGALFAGVALWTGILWDKPASGNWWAWDARLTSELILLFMFLGVMALHAVVEDARRADRAGALLSLVGAVNVPVVFLSIDWWNALHRASGQVPGEPAAMADAMVAGMAAMALGFWAYSVTASMSRIRSIILEREYLGELASTHGGQ